MSAQQPTKVDLATTYLGLSLTCPIVASAGPLTGNLDSLLAIEQAGAGAAVLPSLFEEQIEYDSLAMGYFESFDVGAEAVFGHVPQTPHLTDGPDHYLTLVERAAAALEMPLIASLNGTTPGGWTSFAAMVQDAGADAVELNVYRVASDPTLTGADVEAETLRLVADVRASIDVPLAVKIGPQFSSVSNIAARLVDAGADALVLFNRFYQPEINLDHLTVEPHLELSSPAELRMVLRWIAILRGQLDCSMAATSGVHSSDDVVKALLAGADVAMMTSSLLLHGTDHLRVVLDDVTTWFEERDYISTDQARGSLSQHSIPNPDAFERWSYAQTLASYPRPL